MSQITELKSVVGKEASHNYSPTLRAKLIKVGKSYCKWEVTESPYKGSSSASNNYLAGAVFRTPTWISYNCFFA
jgi:hypothetical protein